jgi:predicted tellurium resistance membrane protein TerC
MSFNEIKRKRKKMESSALKEISSGLPFFKTVNEREKMLGVLGALVLRQISLSKAAEIMGMGKEAFLELLDAMRVEFSYLEENDVETEGKW